MPPPRELLPMLPMAMALDTMASVMLMPTLPSCTEDILATLTLLMGSHSPPALVLTQSLRDLMPPPRELLPMLPMAMALDTMASVMLRLTLPSCTEDMLAMAMLDIPMPMVSPILLTWDSVLTIWGLRSLASSL